MNDILKQKAILYLRFSDAKQIGNTSIASQEESCRRYCESQNYEIVDILKDEAVSASASNDARVAELFDYCKKKKGVFDVLVVFDVNRFARSIEHHIWLRAELRKIGILLRSATQNIDESKEGKLMETILAAFSEFDNSAKKERVKLAMWRRVSEGLWPWAPPAGYIVDPQKPEGARLVPHVIDLAKSRIIKKLFTDYSTGAFSKAALAVRYKIPKQSVDRILSTPYYMGFIKGTEGKMIKGKHQGLISVQMWYRCQEIVDSRTNNTRKTRLQNNPDFPLRGLLICPQCLKNLTACHPKSRRFTKYYCYNKECNLYSKSIDGLDLHEDFKNLLLTLKPTKETENKVKENIIAEFEQRKEEFKTDYIRQMDVIAKLTSEQRWVTVQGRRGEIPEHLAKEQINELEESIFKEKQNLTNVFTKEVDIRELTDYAFNFFRTLDKRWENAEFEAKLMLQRFLFRQKIAYDVVSREFSLLEPSITPLLRLDKITSDPGGIRTPDQVLKRHLLYH